MVAEDLRSEFIRRSADEIHKALTSRDSLAREAAPANLAVFEPRMADRRGHFALLTEHYLSLAKAQGLSSAVFHHRGWSGKRSPGWHSLFPVSDHFVGTGFSVDAEILDRYTRYLEDTLAHALRLTKPRFAVFPTARFLTLPAIARAVSAAPSVEGTIIGVMETWPVPDCDDRELVASAFRRAATILAAGDTPVQIFVESPAIADDLQALGFGVPDQHRLSVRVAPYPAAARLAGNADRQLRGAKPRFLALGASRPVHNPGLLADYLLSAELPPGQWCVRLNEQLAGAHLGMAPDELNARLTARDIQLMPAHLDQPAYDRAILEADLMLLPYGERYETIGSGIFLECLCAGVIPLVPAGSTMRVLYESLGGAAPAIDSLSPGGIADAVNHGVERLAGLRDNAGTVRDRWLQHPHGPECWRERVREMLRTASETR
ncbi:MAG: hypothetical protein V2I57_01905 [Xanthomonadales bacterium]|jgi:hypothetical protein|nr:hypothetical protein [Xanthomonadales bacterium]